MENLTTEYQPQNQGRLVSYSQLAPTIDPIHFLCLARGQERFYWRDSRTDLTFAGMGIAADLMAWGENRFQAIERQARSLFEHATSFQAGHDLARPRLFGGFAFRDDFIPDNTWAGFNPAHFILPHYQLVCRGEERWLTINTLLPLDEDPNTNLPQLANALEAKLSAINHQPPTTNHQQPTTNVYLTQRYADCYCFLFEPRPAHTFFGATPELLVSVEGSELHTMGLAGSIQRGQTPAEDEELAQTLFNSAKDRYEHDLVVQAMERRLRPLTTSLDIPQMPSIYKLSNIQHLYTPVSGQLKQKSGATQGGALPLVETLHPTPALGGAPRDKALQFIRDHEPVPRGWYAAPVGWIDSQMNGAFGVAIRSAVARHQRVWLYAGAGIVADSKPESEWEETGWKFQPILEALPSRIVTVQPSSASSGGESASTSSADRESERLPYFVGAVCNRTLLVESSVLSFDRNV